MTSAPNPRIEFWYEFASTYSYLSAMRIEAMASAAGVGIVWKPLLLGPIFRAQGWNTSPFNVYPVKGKYMVRDMQRLAAARGLPFKLPSPFPQNSLHAARLALIGHAEGWGVALGLLARSEMPESKQRLRQQTEEAQQLGIFGAPSFLAQGELFWGDDRLEQALAVTAGG